MAILYDDLPNHPKILKAGKIIGRDGASRALAMYVAGLCYARKWFTDGFLPDHFVDKFVQDSRPVSVAQALSSRSVHLWHRARGGYRINDYHDVNPPAEKAKRQKELARLRKQRERERKKQQPALVMEERSRVTLNVTRDQIRPLTNKKEKEEVRTSTYESRSQVPGTSTDRGSKEPALRRAACASANNVRAFRRVRSLGTDGTGQPKVSVMTALARSILLADPDEHDDFELRARLKDACAGPANLKYDSRSVGVALDNARRLLEHKHRRRRRSA
jgi:hypothetical protein